MGDNSFVFAKDNQTTCTIVVGGHENIEDLYAASLLASAIEDVVHVGPPICVLITGPNS